MRRPSAPPGARWVPLTKGRSALVDEADFDAVSKLSWHLYTPSKTRTRRTSYACTNVRRPDGKRVKVYLHRWLWERWGLPATEHIDHARGDGLDCRRAKLRAATPAQNVCNRVLLRNNTTGYVGVTRERGRFRARIERNGKKLSLGVFTTAEEAAGAYDAAAARMFGEFARLNLKQTADLAA